MKISLADMDESEQRDAIKEVHIMASLDHKHVVRYYDSFLESHTLHIIMEFCDRGDLDALLRRKSGQSARARPFQNHKLEHLPSSRSWSRIPSFSTNSSSRFKECKCLSLSE